MIKHYYWPTPNGHKTAIMLEEVELESELCPVNILSGDQFNPDFIAISPNHRVPAIIDLDGPEGIPYKVFESGAILLYLAEKTGRLIPADVTGRNETVQWLMFQMANVGPMFGQNGYFQGYCQEDVPLAKKRYRDISNKLYGVMDLRLSAVEYLAGPDYSIADIATYPWVLPKQREMHRIEISQYPNVARWIKAVGKRPAVQRGLSVMSDSMKVGYPTKETYENLFGRSQLEP